MIDKSKLVKAIKKVIYNFIYICIIFTCIITVHMVTYKTAKKDLMVEKDKEIALIKEHYTSINEANTPATYIDVITEDELKEAILTLQPKLDPVIASKASESIVTECKKKDLDPALITGLIFVESTFNPFAESSKGAIGLMQVRYSVWKEAPELKEDGIHEEGALFWIDRNIIAGTNILRKYYQEADCDIRAALYRYNTGKTSFQFNNWNTEYVNKILYYAYIIKTTIMEENKCGIETMDVNEPQIEEIK